MDHCFIVIVHSPRRQDGRAGIGIESVVSSHATAGPTGQVGEPSARAEATLVPVLADRAPSTRIGTSRPARKPVILGDYTSTPGAWIRLTPLTRRPMFVSFPTGNGRSPFSPAPADTPCPRELPGAAAGAADRADRMATPCHIVSFE